MTTELKQAAQRALLALRSSQPHPSNPFIGLNDNDFIDHEETIRQLRNALQQADHTTQTEVTDRFVLVNRGTIESAMQHVPYRGEVWQELNAAIPALRAALAQQPTTPEPVAWVVMNGVSKYQVCGAKAPADALCSEMQKRHDLSGSLAAFHVLPLYTHAAPSVPDDAKRLNWLDDTNKRFRMGWEVGQAPAGNVSIRTIITGGKSIRDAIDAAMLAAKEASA